MATKLQFFSTVAERAAKDIIAKTGNWQSFLDTAARLYKYPFPDQLLIYAQRPDAIACAPLETWNDTFNRWVRRGTTGIALIDDTGDRPRLKYVFDVSDTEPSQYRSRPVQLWEMQQEHRLPVLEHLSGIYDDLNDTLADSFRSIAKQLAREYYEDNATEIRNSSEDSFLEELDDLNLSVAFEEVLTNSVAYSIISRCGLDTSDYFDDDDFRRIYEFNTPDMIYALGTAAGELSQQVLRDIELIIRRYERQHAAERSAENERSNDILPERGLHDTQHDFGRTAEGADGAIGQIREDTESLPQRAPDNIIQFNAAQRDVVPTSTGDRRVVQQETGASDESSNRSEQIARQNDRPDGLDSDDERIESTSGRDGIERTRLRIDEEETELQAEQGADEKTAPFSMTEHIVDHSELISPVDNTSILETLSTSSITLDELDSILRDGGNDKNSILRIAAFLSKGLSHEDNTELLRREYLMGQWGRTPTPEGKGFQFGAQQTSVWFDENGIIIGRGNSALSATDFALITWEQSAERIKSLYDNGLFVSHDVLEEAIYNEHKDLAGDFIEVYGNINRGLSDIQYELRNAMDKEQKDALKDDWKQRRYLIKGLTELSNRSDETLNNENGATTEEILQLYNETFSISEEIPQEWAYGSGHPETVEAVTELLRDKGEPNEDEIAQGLTYSQSSKYALLVDRLREDITLLNDEPDAPIRFYRNPHRVLNKIEMSSMPVHGFPTAEITPLNFMRFITEDEVNQYLTRGSNYDECKLRIMAFFLQNNIQKDRENFLKQQYGHGGGSWTGGGWSDAEPGKGIRLHRPNCEDVTLKWNRVSQRIDGLIQSGQYMTRQELTRTYNYERLVLARQIQNFHYNLPDEHERPFPADLDLHNSWQDEWETINGLLDDSERVEALLGQMQYIYANTPEEDRYYSLRKVAYENLVAFRDSRYTLFPGLENLPDPEVIDTKWNRTIENSNAVFSFPQPLQNAATQQLSIFEMDAPSLFPGVEEQQAKIEHLNEQAPVVETPAVTLPITQDEIDALLLTVSDERKAQISAQFAESPRSREAVRLIRDVYGSIEETMPRFDGEPGYLGALWDNTGNGILISRGAPASTPLSERPTAETLELSWAAVHKRVVELVEDKQFTVQEQESDNSLVEESIKPQPITPLDFNSVAQTVLQRVMQDTDYVEVLVKAASRASMRNPCTWALEQSIRDHEHDEPDVYHAYFNDEDFNDRLFDYILRQSWTDRNKTGEPVTEQQIPDELNNNIPSTDSETDDLPPYKLRDTFYTGDGKSYVVQWIGPFEIGYFDSEIPYISKLMNKDEFESLLRNVDLNGHLFLQNEAFTEITDPDVITEVNEVFNYNEVHEHHSTLTVPPPVFFVDWSTAQSDFDLNLYNDRDVIGYNKEGVEYAVGRSRNITYIATTTGITPWGDILGATNIPRDIWAQMNEYHDGNLTDEQVRINYLSILDSFKTQNDFELPGNQTQEPKKQLSIPVGTNFRITNDALGEGGAKTKFRYNLDAIITLKTVEREMRSATPDEQQILSRYVGWGGLPQAFDPDNSQWRNEYKELLEVLTTEEFESARASTINAHYTTPVVIRSIYETVERLGFKTGNILEPSCGVGNFFGLLPDSLKDSKLYGVELDSVTARIAKQLYPQASIKEMGFEKTDMPDAFFDLAVGNVPFGAFGVADKRYDKHHFNLHNYFFAKSLDQVRPGGIIAYLTSKYTMDEKNPKVRKYFAERAELLGAVRLPNDAFLKNAGTETTTDLIFLQKRDRPMDIEPEWVHLGMTKDGLPVNRYYIDNPEMLLGTMALDERMNNKYGRDDLTACLPIEGADLAQQLNDSLINIRGQYVVEELDDIEGVDNHAVPADPSVRNFSYALVTSPVITDDENIGIHAVRIGEGEVYFRENSLMYPVDLPVTTLERIKGMITLRDCVHELIILQLDEHSESEIRAKQLELNSLYDQFAADYGLINSTANSRAFNADSAYYLLCSLEILNEDGELDRKADMFTKRTIKQRIVVDRVDTASEALAVSLGEKAGVDIEYMAQLTGRDEETLFAELRGVIYKDLHGFPDGKHTYRTADEFLSGNIREKLKRYNAGLNYTNENHPNYETVTANIAALEKAMPKELEASEIAVRLGSTWIDPQYVQQFMHQLLKTSWRNQDVYQVKYHQYTGEWQVTGKGRSAYSDVLANVTYGTGRMNAYQIIDDTLNLRDVRVYDYVKDADGKEKRVLNKKETTLAQQKQEQIKQAFKDWIWQDPDRRQTLVTLYNERFNSIRPRQYDGSHITFSGISPEITLMPHQMNAIAHGLYGENLLLAHVVGAGKTFEMVAMAMESKRLGLCHKSLFSVPNHLTEQWAGEFLRLYPSANILVATKKDFEMRNRKKFCAKIATGDYDAVIIGHSQLEKIPISRERQERHLREQLWEIEQGIEDLKSSRGERFSIKQLEKTKKSIEARLEKLLDAKKRDDVVTFEQLGVDRLFVDEAHNFKNLFMYTKMRNVAGLSTSEAQKSSDLFMKCRYMDELTNSRGIIFATGTPISNSMTEMYTMQRYLQYDSLSAKGLTHFDCWASTFGETQTSIELAPEGTGYRARTRFAKFHNLPELMCMFKEVADIQTADMLNLPVPEAKFENIIVEPSDMQKEMVQELSQRAARVHAQLVDAKIDNMLKITTDGRKIGLDQRLMNPLLPDFDGSKVNACTDNVYRIWDETKDGRLTQLVFCDFSTPNKDGRFNIYDDIKAKLIERGVPEHEIAFIHDADTETRKKELFAKVRQGKVRVLFGSTFKMGAGTNVQDRLIAIHDADCPWRPADLEQRAGRIVRQGNKNDEVQIYRYATSGTFDSYLWQTVEAKQKFIAQIMTSKSPARSCEDVDETALSYAEIKALCAGNPLIAEKMNLDVEVAKLRMLKSEHQSQHFRLQDNLLKHYPQQITSVKERIAGIEKDMVLYNEQHAKLETIQPMIDGSATTTAKFAGMVIHGVEHIEKEPAAKALLETCKGVSDRKDLQIGSYMGFEMSIRYDSFHNKFSVLLRGNMTYETELGTDAFGNITRINNTLADLPKKLSGAKTQLDNLYQQQESAKQELDKPFGLASELREKEARLALINADLNIDGDGGFDVINDDGNRDENDDIDEPPDIDYDDEEFVDIKQPMAVSAKSARPSLMEGLRTFSYDKHQSGPGKKTGEINI